jgi:hypothetical protein
MKAATMAPVFAHMYPRLAEAARGVGYALALHGTLGRDLDLIACPWTNEAADPEALVAALEAACGGFAPEVANTAEGEPTPMPRPKPHGRLAWLIYFRGGAGYVDLSVMPRAASPAPVIGGEESER